MKSHAFYYLASTLDFLHASVNSAKAQLNINAQKSADLETRMTTWENNVADLDNSPSQRQNRDIILKDKLEDLKNRGNYLCFIGIPEHIGDDQLA